MNGFCPFSSLLPVVVLLCSLPNLGCGSRTELLGQEPCAKLGAMRSCKDVCGDGQQICADGYWQACEVPPTEMECSDNCGVGRAICENRKMGACVVEKVSKSCSNDCGNGQMWCKDNAWGKCEVLPQNRSCNNDCGAGNATCVDGKWSDCVVPRKETTCSSACGQGVEICENGVKIPCNAPAPLPPKLHAVIRDFREDHIDFEISNEGGSLLDKGIVATRLGDDNLPVYASSGPTITVSGKASFDQWYRDVPGVNLTTAKELQLQPSKTTPGLFVYEDPEFFPVDGQLFGDEVYDHNYHFTLMVSTEFVYVGGEEFSFEGDDDMWVFINRELAIDLGGIHQSEYGSISLDAEAARLGITRGGRYRLDFFFAERHTVESHFTVRTTIADVGSCP